MNHESMLFKIEEAKVIASLYNALEQLNKATEAMASTDNREQFNEIYEMKSTLQTILAEMMSETGH